MAQYQAFSAAAEQWVRATGSTFLTASIPPGMEPETLTVVDHITVSTINGTANGTVTLGIGARNVIRKNIAATGGDTTDLDFAGGFPQWKTSGSDGEPFRYSDGYETAPDSVYNVKGGVAAEAEQAVGFSFTASADGSMNAIVIRVAKVGNPTDLLFVEFTNTDINTAAIATSLSNRGATLTTAPQWIPFFYATPQGLGAGTKYFFRVFRTGARDAVNYYTVDVTTTSGLANGGAYKENATIWSAESATDDADFRVLSGIPCIMTAPASSTNSTILITYHYENPMNIRT